MCRRDFVVRQPKHSRQSARFSTNSASSDNSGDGRFNANDLKTNIVHVRAEEGNLLLPVPASLKNVSAMKVHRLRALVWLLPMLVILLAGCATHHPMVSAWHNSQFTLTRTDKIALTLRPDPSAQDAELNRLLVAELKQEGFNLVPIEQADYLLACTLEDELVDQGRSVTMTTPASPPQTTGQIMDQSLTGGYSTGPTFPANSVLKPVVFRHRGIRLFLYNNPQTHPGGLQIVWQGYIAVGGTTTAEHETALIKTLLSYLGQEQHGSVNLAK